VEHLFSVSPFGDKPFCDYFNIFFVHLNSQERGIGYGKANNTALRCYYYNSSDIVFDDVNFFGGRKAPNPFDVAAKYVPGIKLSNTVVVVLVNDTRLGYTTGPRNVAPYNQWISIISVSDDPEEFKRLVLREVGGKAFARLAQEDDYFNFEYKEHIQDWYTRYGFYANVDVTGERANVKWRHFLSYPSLYPELGIYHAENGVYRPDNNNVMLYNGALRYDAPSREAIIQRIYQIHEWPYDLNTFRYYFVY